MPPTRWSLTITTGTGTGPGLELFWVAIGDILNTMQKAGFRGREDTPKLIKVAERGVRFTRLYAAGTATYISTPLMQRSTDGMPANADRRTPL